MAASATAASRIEAHRADPRNRAISAVRRRCQLLRVGQAFVVPVAGRAEAADAKMAAHAYGRSTGKKFRTGADPDVPSHYRIERVA